MQNIIRIWLYTPVPRYLITPTILLIIVAS